MTREDAVTTLKDISEMVHKQKEIEKSTLYGILDSNNEPIEALDMAIKALEQEPCDCISREEVCDYIAEFVNHEYATDRERELVKNIIDGIQHLPSIQPKKEWIPVSERLPGYGDKVLCWTTYNAFVVGYRDNDWGQDVWTTGAFASGTFSVVAWMPLPEPYKAESEGKK